MSRILIVSGSPNKTSRLRGLNEYAFQYLLEKGFSISILDVIDIPAENLVLAQFDSEAVKSATQKVEEADAIIFTIFTSQVYKASYTGVLKTFLDLLPQRGLEDKVVLPFVLGGTLAHFLTIQYSFHPVFSTLAAEHILQGIYVLDSDIVWNDNGTLDIEDTSQLRIHKALDQLSGVLASLPIDQK
ncbi:NADPH-dependent FMN reductase [Halalkalibacterium ligniniphilum]|uniref:NADPH-dependent FMN reductase n=1 Tax=Halalkalibacterium ligniniphilum TaxID=1134413 RepID=UPI000346A662|nr:NADPH-dependent FMN reductase [Halalkalibacterium ligniniphilum]